MRIGTDPEFLIVEKATSKPVPAWRFFNGKDAKHPLIHGWHEGRKRHDNMFLSPEKLEELHKEAESRRREERARTGYEETMLPYPVGDGDGLWAFRDGYMVELNMPGQVCRQSLHAWITKMIQALQDAVGDKYSIVAQPATRISLRQLEDAPGDCKTFGCDPSLDAYTGREKRPEINASEHPYRYAGGHMHISGNGDRNLHNELTHAWVTGDNPEQHMRFIKLCDLYIGLPMSLLFNTPMAFLRRRVYGQAGEYRRQVYKNGFTGLEYRTPGPEMFYSRVLTSLFFGVLKQIGQYPHLLWPKWDEAMADDVRGAINEGPTKTTWKLLRPVPMIYEPETVKRLMSQVRNRSEFHGWQRTGPVRDWGNYALVNKLPAPTLDFNQTSIIERPAAGRVWADPITKQQIILY